ncbi:hypothetical protein TNCV_3736081 [Trichonephila clavipes]|nr:hypothetical protein TNCV_3736081 [Trichonephila clavipes]
MSTAKDIEILTSFMKRPRKGVSNAVCKLETKVENIVDSHNYIGKHGWKAIGGTVRQLSSSAHMVCSFQTGAACNEHESLPNGEFADIHFNNGLANGNGRVAVRLSGERYPTRWQPNHPTFDRVHQNLLEHGTLIAKIYDTPINSKMDLLA